MIIHWRERISAFVSEQANHLQLQVCLGTPKWTAGVARCLAFAIALLERALSMLQQLVSHEALVFRNRSALHAIFLQRHGSAPEAQDERIPPPAVLDTARAALDYSHVHNGANGR